jgi:hypothetical protein
MISHCEDRVSSFDMRFQLHFNRRVSFHQLADLMRLDHDDLMCSMPVSNDGSVGGAIFYLKLPPCCIFAGDGRVVSILTEVALCSLKFRLAVSRHCGVEPVDKLSSRGVAMTECAAVGNPAVTWTLRFNHSCDRESDGIVAVMQSGSQGEANKGQQLRHSLLGVF